MSKYFKNVETLEELRRQYKELLKQYHPDNPDGSTEATQAINNEYEKLFELLKNRHESKQTNTASSKQSTYNQNMYDWENDKTLREVLSKIINFRNIDIYIIGQWIWVDGNTYPYKKELKELGFKWASEKKKWYFHTEAFRKSSNRKLSMKDIMSYYGSTKVHTHQYELLEA